MAITSRPSISPWQNVLKRIRKRGFNFVSNGIFDPTNYLTTGAVPRAEDIRSIQRAIHRMVPDYLHPTAPFTGLVAEATSPNQDGEYYWNVNLRTTTFASENTVILQQNHFPASLFPAGLAALPTRGEMVDADQYLAPINAALDLLVVTYPAPNTFYGFEEEFYYSDESQQVGVIRTENYASMCVTCSLGASSWSSKKITLTDGIRSPASTQVAAPIDSESTVTLLWQYIGRGLTCGNLSETRTISSVQTVSGWGTGSLASLIWGSDEQPQGNVPSGGETQETRIIISGYDIMLAGGSEMYYDNPFANQPAVPTLGDCGDGTEWILQSSESVPLSITWNPNQWGIDAGYESITATQTVTRDTYIRRTFANQSSLDGEYRIGLALQWDY